MVPSNEENLTFGPSPNVVSRLETKWEHFLTTYQKKINVTALTALLVAYFAYFTYAMYLDFQKNIALFVLTILATLLIVYGYIEKKLHRILENAVKVIQNRLQQHRCFVRWLPWLVYLVGFGIVFGVMSPSIAREPSRLVSLAGLLVLFLLSFIISKDQGKINVHLVIRSLLVQLVIALLVLRWETGANAVRWFSEQMATFLSYRRAGQSYVFGPKEADHPFAMTTITVVFFFGAMLNILSYLGVMQRIIMAIGWAISMATGAGPIMAFVSAANIFLGGAEAASTIAPQISKMTPSEIHSMMTCGFASISGAVMAIFMAFGVPGDNLVSASLMSAPAALAIGNVIFPETGTSLLTHADAIQFPPHTEVNVLHAAVSGATKFGRMYAFIIAPILSFLAIMSFLNSFLLWLGTRVGLANLSMQLVFSYLFYPLTIMMGVDPRDVLVVGELIGVSFFFNAVIPVRMLGNLINNRSKGVQPMLASGRSEVIATYALAKFANISALALNIGSISSLCPEKRPDIASVSIRALVSGNIAAFVTACIAGILY